MPIFIRGKLEILKLFVIDRLCLFLQLMKLLSQSVVHISFVYMSVGDGPLFALCQDLCLQILLN